MSNLSSYVGYFRGLAVSHKDLQHDPDSELPDGDPSKCHFIRWSMEDAVIGINNKIGFPLLLLEIYEQVTESQMIYDVKKNCKGAITIVDHVTNDNDLIGQEVALITTESIMSDVLKQMWQDRYGQNAIADNPFKEIYFNGMNIIPVDHILSGKEFGWRTEFNFIFKDNQDITQPPAEGTFI